VIGGGAASAGTFRAFRHPAFRRFWFAGLVSLVGSWMQMTAHA
jgi:hypothetical protein